MSASTADLIISLLGKITLRGLKPATKVIQLPVYTRVQNLSCGVLCVPYEIVSFFKLNKFGLRVMWIIVIKAPAYTFILGLPVKQALFVSDLLNRPKKAVKCNYSE